MHRQIWFGLSVDARPNSDISPSISLSTPVENSHNFFRPQSFCGPVDSPEVVHELDLRHISNKNPHSRIARSFKSEEISVTVEILESREHRMPKISNGASTPSLEQHLHTISLDAQTPNETGKTTTLKCPIPKHRPAWKTPHNKPQPVATTFAPQPSTNSIGLLTLRAPDGFTRWAKRGTNHFSHHHGRQWLEMGEKRDRKKRRYRMERQDKREDWMRRTVRHCPASGYQSLNLTNPART